MRPGTVRDSVTVGSPVVDAVSSTTVTTHFDSLRNSPASPGRAISPPSLANTPGVAMSKMDVGGNGALSLAGIHRLRAACDDRA